MAVQTTPGVVPQWTLQDRIRKAREHAGLSQQELADRLSVTRTSVINWERGHTIPLRPLLELVAERTGVDLEWLAGPAKRTRGGYEKLPRVDSNHQPAGLWREPPAGTSEIVSMTKPLPELRRRIRHGEDHDPVTKIGNVS